MLYEKTETLGDLLRKAEEAYLLLEPTIDQTSARIRGVDDIGVEYRRVSGGADIDVERNVVKQSPIESVLGKVKLTEFHELYLRQLEDIFGDFNFGTYNIDYASISRDENTGNDKVTVDFDNGLALEIWAYNFEDGKREIQYHLRKIVKIIPDSQIVQTVNYEITSSGVIGISPIISDSCADNSDEVKKLLEMEYLTEAYKSLFKGIDNTGHFGVRVRHMKPQANSCSIGRVPGEIEAGLFYGLAISEKREDLLGLRVGDIISRFNEMEEMVSCIYDSGLLEEMNQTMYV